MSLPPLPPLPSRPPLPGDLMPVRAALGLQQQPGPEKSVSPGPAANDGGFELQVTATVGAGREVMEMAGQNDGGFENRASTGSL